MKNCKQCGVYFADDSNICPLCHCALTLCDNNAEAFVAQGYPTNHMIMKQRSLVLRILLSAVIVTEAILIIVNIYTESRSAWSLFTGIYLLYTYLLARFSVFQNGSGRWRIITGTILTALLIFAVDTSNGYSGWSINYFFPISFAVLDIMVLVLILVRKDVWQSYLVVQLTLIAMTGVGLLLIPLGLMTRPKVSILVFIMSVLCFTVTVIIGGQKAREELKRRFHISRSA